MTTETAENSTNSTGAASFVAMFDRAPLPVTVSLGGVSPSEPSEPSEQSPAFTVLPLTFGEIMRVRRARFENADGTPAQNSDDLTENLLTCILVACVADAAGSKVFDRAAAAALYNNAAATGTLNVLLDAAIGLNPTLLNARF